MNIPKVACLVVLALLAMMPNAGNAQNKDAKNGDDAGYIKAEIKGRLGRWPGGKELWKPYLRVNEVFIHLNMTGQKAKNWEPLVGKTVIVTGRLEIRENEPTKTSDGIKNKTNLYVRVDTLRALDERINIALARDQCKLLKRASQAYQLDTGNPPRQINDLFALPRGMTLQKWRGPYLRNKPSLDPWGNPYRVLPGENQQAFNISSAGPDGKPGTDDDIGSDDR